MNAYKSFGMPSAGCDCGNGHDLTDGNPQMRNTVVAIRSEEAMNIDGYLNNRHLLELFDFLLPTTRTLLSKR